jgi:hypothetical protein
MEGRSEWLGRSSCIRFGKLVVAGLGWMDQEVGVMTQQMVWKCEQWVGGRIKDQSVFMSEQQARDFARKLTGMSPDMVFKIEPMPIQHVWN